MFAKVWYAVINLFTCLQIITEIRVNRLFTFYPPSLLCDRMPLLIRNPLLDKSLFSDYYGVKP